MRIGPDLKHAIAFVARLGREDIDELLPALKRAAPFLRGAGGARGAVEVRARPDVPAGSGARLCQQDRPAAALARGGAGSGRAALTRRDGNTDEQLRGAAMACLEPLLPPRGPTRQIITGGVRNGSPPPLCHTNYLGQTVLGHCAVTNRHASRAKRVGAHLGNGDMELVQHSHTLHLTGLTSHQLRDWTVRRRFVVPDREPNGPGTRASFSWRSVLMLRLLSALHHRFGVGLEEGRRATDSLRAELQRQSFVALWGKLVVAHEDLRAELANAAPKSAAYILIPLDPHLEVISEGFRELPHPPQQLSLLPVFEPGTAA